LEDITQVGYCLIADKWYIYAVSKNGLEWKAVKPLPTTLNNQNKHPDNEQQITLSSTAS
jgi:hypothetical protein